MASERPRLAIFTTHPIQYQAPLFRRLAERGQVHPIVLFGSRHGLDASLDKGFGTVFQWDVPLVEGFEHYFVENVARHPDVDRFRGIRLRDASALLRDGRFDAVLVLGWNTLAHLQMIRAARRLGLPLLLRGESNLLRKPPSKVRGALRSLLWLPLRRRLYSRVFAGVDAFLTIGSRNGDYYRAFGVPPSKLYIAPYGVNNARFALPPAAAAEARARIRRDHGISQDAVMFLGSAKIIAPKRPFDLLAAFGAVASSGRDVHLVYVGDGALRAAVQEAAAKAGIGDRVTITGFVNQRAMPEWYAAADCLVLPSDTFETWGLVVNEAMAGGLPVIVSDAVGCAPDLVAEGENGFTFPLGDRDALMARMVAMVDAGPAGRRAMGARSRAIVAHFDLDHVADALERAVCETGSSVARVP